MKIEISSWKKKIGINRFHKSSIRQKKLRARTILKKEGMINEVDDDYNQSDSQELLELSTKNEEEEDEIKKKSVWITLLFGQFLSIANAGTGAAATSLAERCNINNPTTQSGFFYVIISCCLFFLPQDTQVKTNRETKYKSVPRKQTRLPLVSPQPILFRNDKKKFNIQGPLYYYAILAFMDLEANYLTYYAYRYTSFTSITLLASVSIPSAMFFSYVLMSRKYHARHIIGVCLCLVGFLMTFKSDMTTNSNDSSKDEDVPSYSNAIKGDFLAFLGALLYGLNDTLAESSVKRFHPLEYLGMLGFFGSIISLIQISILEPSVYKTVWDTLRSKNDDDDTCSVTQVTLLLLWNASSLACYYIGAAFFLLRYDAALLDVSLLSTNMYAYAFVVFSNVTKTPLHSIEYFVAMGFVMIGVSIYEMGHSFLNLCKKNTHDLSDEEFHHMSVEPCQENINWSFEYGSLA